jgi:hypothetical protein
LLLQNSKFNETIQTISKANLNQNSLDVFLVNFFNQHQCLLLPRCIYQEEQNSLISITEPNSLDSNSNLLSATQHIKTETTAYEYNTPLLLLKKDYDNNNNDNSKRRNLFFKCCDPQQQQRQHHEVAKKEINTLCAFNRCMWDTEIITRENSFQPEGVSIIWSIPLDPEFKLLLGVFCSPECASAFDYQYFKGKNQYYIKKLRSRLFLNCKNEKIKLLGSILEPLYSAPPCFYLDKFYGPLSLEKYRNLYNIQSKVIRGLKCVMKEPRWHITSGSTMITDIMPLEINVRKRKKYTHSPGNNSNLFQSRRGMIYQEIELCPFPYKIVKQNHATNNNNNNNTLEEQCLKLKYTRPTTTTTTNPNPNPNTSDNNNSHCQKSLIKEPFEICNKTLSSSRLAITKCVPYIKHNIPQNNNNASQTLISTSSSIPKPINDFKTPSNRNVYPVSDSKKVLSSSSSSSHSVKTKFNNEKKHVYQNVVNHSFHNSVQIASGKSAFNQRHQCLSSSSKYKDKDIPSITKSEHFSTSNATVVDTQSKSSNNNTNQHHTTHNYNDDDSRRQYKQQTSERHDDNLRHTIRHDHNRHSISQNHLVKSDHDDFSPSSRDSYYHHHECDRNERKRTYSTLSSSYSFPPPPPPPLHIPPSSSSTIQETKLNQKSFPNHGSSSSSAKTLFQPSRSAARVRNSCEKKVNYEIAKRNCFQQLY